MTGIIEVDTQALDRLASQIRSAAAQSHAVAGQAASGALHARLGMLGSPSLSRAASEFVENWSGVLCDLVADANRLADAITLAARSYQDAEAGIGGRLIP